MTNCSKCGKEVSERAEHCPHCGEVRPGASEGEKKAFNVLLTVIFILGMLCVFMDAFMK